ncbi:hypothetical protein [Microbacterium sp. p3-SID336]|uniref:hypothetical protein n=1 Tax=Microbacterium sp. p3-SID336 TaxID=2916212 RepID=UPI0021A74C4F|nr:hypothetical protein [Microbacterium sp. p3-SID336]MCT1478367.1 hypothetical protein [Microbacterium sp. p3-SID336]
MLKEAVTRVAAGALGLLGAVILAGCVPSRPVFMEPVALTVVDDQFAWVQCLDETWDIDYISTALREEWGSEDEVVLFSATADEGQAVAVPPGEPILPDTFPDFSVTSSREYPVSSLDGPVTVYVILSGPDHRAEMSFKNVAIDSLVEGTYVYHSGEVSNEPCDMDDE